MPASPALLLRRLVEASRAAAAGGAELRFIEEIEWTGELPFGSAASLRCGSAPVGFDWDAFDLQALENLGYIEAVSRLELSADGLDLRITWRITEAGVAHAGGGPGPPRSR